jgi:CTP synthase
MVKYIFVVGGVISGVGKGIACASIGRILIENGFSVTAVKIDPYINCDAGTMRPTEHGEVWVTKDGGEIDQDLGNYERFLEIELSKDNNLTTGKIYKEIIDKERRGDFLGETVSIIPHVPNLVKDKIKKLAEGYDVCLIEIGGTIGDYENVPFLFAAKSLENELGRENVIHVLVTYMPIPSHLDEMKTKPTQLAIRLLMENGIQPDFIICRGRDALDDIRKKKLASYSNIDFSEIISAPDVIGENTVNSLYTVPLNFEKDKLGEKILKKLKLESKKQPEFKEWKEKMNAIYNPQKEINVALICKYLDSGNFQLRDSYISVTEALQHAGANNNCKVNIDWLNSKKLQEKPEELLKYNGVIVPGGFGSSGVEGKINAIKFVRENEIPFLGLCYGMQLAVIEYARNVCGLKDANTTEIDDKTTNPVIDIMPEQKLISEKGASMRLGEQTAILKEDTQVFDIYGKKEISERHRHRYEVNPEFHKILTDAGLVFSGFNPSGILAEFIELPKDNHPFFIATQAHPEFKSSLLVPSPLFDAFVKACIKNYYVKIIYNRPSLAN